MFFHFICPSGRCQCEYPCFRCHDTFPTPFPSLSLRQNLRWPSSTTSKSMSSTSASRCRRCRQTDVDDVDFGGVSVNIWQSCVAEVRFSSYLCMTWASLYFYVFARQEHNLRTVWRFKGKEAWKFTDNGSFPWISVFPCIAFILRSFCINLRKLLVCYNLFY